MTEEKFCEEILNYLLNIKLNVLIYDFNTFSTLGSEIVETQDYFFTGKKLGACHLYICKTYNKQEVSYRATLLIKTEKHLITELNFKNNEANLIKLADRLKSLCSVNKNNYDEIIKEINDAS